VLVGNDEQFINRLTTADLTFKLESNTAIAPVYEIIPVAPVNVTAESANRYMFNFDGVTQPDETAGEIVIGQVKISGYGAYTFFVDAAADETNIVNATKTNDNIVEHFVVGGAANNQGELDINDRVADTITVPTRDLEIVIDFNNSVDKNAVDYQDMTVTISGGDLAEAIEIELGDEYVDNAITTEYDKADAKYTVDASVDNQYTVEVLDVLSRDVAYNVTVSGAGYRTARYTVTMACEDGKKLTFWNNVMDVDQVVETGKAASATKLNFLAGDILEDNKINIYDLSAVVSYFGQTGTAANGYAQYDLNRDTVIDSKDVAYVLVSWNN